MLRLSSAVFLAGAALMGLEIVGSRVLAPVFGTSILVWGALITTFLVSLAAGYALGGRVADRRPRAELLSDLLALSAGLLWILCYAPAQVLAAAERLPIPGRFRPLAAALLLFAPPSILMGMATPFAVRLAARDLASVGSAAGRLSAISTAGSILGTFATAFILIPSFSLRPILYGLGASLLLAALLLVSPRSVRFWRGLALAGLGALAFLVGRSSSGREDAPGTVLLEKETAYHHIKVFDDGRYRSLTFDHLRQGRLPRNPKEEPPLSYADGLQMALAFPRTPPRSLVLIGLGAGMVPKSVGERMPDLELTSIEIDPEVVSVAETFFGFRKGPRNRVLVGDGRRVLTQEIPARSVDAIFLDAYFSDSLPFHLVTREFFETVRAKLTDDGVFAANFVGAMCGKDDALFWAAYRTIRTVLPRVYVFSSELHDGKRTFMGNTILVATVSPDGLDAGMLAARVDAFAKRMRRPEIATWGGWLYEGEVFTKDLPVLTDEYGPTDALQHLRR